VGIFLRKKNFIGRTDQLQCAHATIVCTNAPKSPEEAAFIDRNQDEVARRFVLLIRTTVVGVATCAGNFVDYSIGLIRRVMPLLPRQARSAFWESRLVAWLKRLDHVTLSAA